jgi:hypothetical protein
LGAAAQERDFDAVVDLLVELSSVVAVDQRGEDYLLDHPELVVALGDAEALRRLFESKTRWPGTRHARLAIAYTADGDTAEAYNHARRADEWMRWLHRQDHRTRVDVRPATDEDVAVPLYFLARGRTTEAARYIERWNDPYGYELALRMFEVSRVSAAVGKFPNLQGIIETVVRCPKASPPVIMAVLTKFPTIIPAASSRLLQRLFKGLPAGTAPGDRSPAYGKSDSYRLALQRSSLRAAQLRLSSEALAIDSHVSPKRYDFWALRDPFSTQYILPWVLSIATRAMAENRAPTLFDCIPEEFLQLVTTEPAPASDEDQKKALEQKLHEKPSDGEGGNKQQKSKLSMSDRQNAHERLRTHVMPVLSVSRLITGLLRAQTEADQRTAVLAFFEGWKSGRTNAQKDMYYPNDQNRYLDNLYSAAILHVLTATGLFTPEGAIELAEWMQRSEYATASLCIDFIERFAAVESCHEHAGRMAVEAVKAIEKEDDVEYRAKLFARLARALLSASRAEAAALFARGLSELDAIGSGDYAFTNDLLWFSASLAPAPMPPETALRLAKICELNLYDSSKFPWPLAGRAFSKTSGLSYLAQIARWHDRDKADLELTLPAALSFLLRDRLIVPEDAIGLLSLVEPIEMWDWGWEDIFESLIEVRPPNLFILLNELFDQFERAFPARPRAQTLTDVKRVLEKFPTELAAVKPRLGRLEARASQARQNQGSSSGDVPHQLDDDGFGQREAAKEEEIDKACAETDPSSTESVEALINKLDEIDGSLDGKSRAFKKLRPRIKYADQNNHIRAIIAARNVGLSVKIRLIDVIKAEWLGSSPTRLAVLKGVGTRLVRDHAPELIGKDWGLQLGTDSVGGRHGRFSRGTSAKSR